MSEDDVTFDEALSGGRIFESRRRMMCAGEKLYRDQQPEFRRRSRWRDLLVGAGLSAAVIAIVAGIAGALP